MKHLPNLNIEFIYKIVSVERIQSITNIRVHTSFVK